MCLGFRNMWYILQEGVMNLFDGRAWRKEHKRAEAECGLLKLKRTIPENWDPTGSPKKLADLLRAFIQNEPLPATGFFFEASMGYPVSPNADVKSKSDQAINSLYSYLARWEKDLPPDYNMAEDLEAVSEAISRLLEANAAIVLSPSLRMT